MLTDLLAGLNPDQQDAVREPPSGFLKIAAGAGSGKTEVLTRRVVALLRQGIRPVELVAITYTRKAAAEMKERLALPARGLTASVLRNLQVSTFHAFLGDLLRRDPFGAGIDRGDAVLTEGGRRLLLADLLEEFRAAHADALLEGAEAFGPDLAHPVTGLFPGLLGHVRRFLLSPGGFQRFTDERFARRGTPPSPLEKNVQAWFFRFYSRYLQKLAERHLLDFDEILLRSSALIADQRAAGSDPVQRVFLIDEFQDNNQEQFGIIRTFIDGREGHITVVGDEKQSIYRFQGADIRTFHAFPATRTIWLNQNYRSVQEILTLADRYISYNIDNPPPPQTADRGGSTRPGPVACLLAAAPGSTEEAETVANLIQTLVGGGLAIETRQGKRPAAYGDFAIIVHSVNRLPRAYEDALLARGIPYVMAGGLGFYARHEIAAVVAFLRLLVRPTDDLSLATILTGPQYGLSDTELATLFHDRREDRVSLLAHLLALPESALPERVRSFRRLFIRLQGMSGTLGILDLVHAVLEQAGFLEHAAAQTDDLRRRRLENNLAKFVGIVRAFESNGIFTTLRDFLAYHDRTIESGVDEDEAGLGLEEGEAVKILTIHKSKGLEFPVVFLPNLRTRTFKREQGLFMTRDQGLVVHRKECEGSPEAEIRAVFDAEQAANLGEERRKLYVALTRARDLLVISGSETDLGKPGQPIGEVAEMLRADGTLGSVGPLAEWPSVAERWLAAGTVPPLPAEVSAEPLPNDNAGDLAPQIAALAGRIRRDREAATAAGRRSGTGMGEEIYALGDLAAYEECPRRYFFQRRHIAPLAGPAEAARGPAVGNLVHRTLRLYHETCVSALPAAARRERLFGLLDRLVPLHGEEGAAGRERAAALLGAYLASPLAATDAAHLEAEVNLRLAVEGTPAQDGPFLLRGFADRIDLRDGEIYIIDYKTHGFSPALHAAYARQLALYLAAARRGLFGRSGSLAYASAALAYLTETAVRIEPVDPDLPAFERAATALVARIRAERTWQPPSEAPCAGCAFAALCAKPPA
ncbi:MAG TPA: ATP-dependent DNA helicase [Candidatus Ozemobacteraceae bacterium]|nr:ATP-dependent DNA helicase [Candidatus Ozemobacteraceae bacterium]